MSKLFKKVTVLILAVALLVPGLSAFANDRHVFPAHFFPAGGYEPGQRWDQDTGSLTVVRVAGPVIGDHPAYLPPDHPNHQRIPGVPVRITLVQIDDLNNPNPTDTENTTPVLVNGNPVIHYRVTDANGEAVFNDLPLGLWLVEELASTPAESPIGAVTNPINSTADNTGDGPRRFNDFLVAIPRFTDVEGAEWEFDVTVYPKSDFPRYANEKNLVDLVGDVATWTLTHRIPNAVQNLPYFGVTDVMSSGLTFTPPVTGRFETAPGEWRDLLPAHFEVAELTDANGIYIEFTQYGLDYLGEHGLAVQGNVEFRVQTTVNNHGAHSNIAVWNVGRPGGDNYCPEDDPDCELPCPPTDEDCDDPCPEDEDCDTVTFENFLLELLKVNEAGQALEGAVFALYRQVAAGTPNAVNVSAGVYVVPLTNATGAQITGATGSNGITTFEDTPMASIFHQIWLREVYPPEGYRIVDAWMPIIIDSYHSRPGTGVGVDYVATFIVDVEVLNVPEGGWNLPQTGGVGTIFLTVGGLVLVGGALVLFVGSKKDEEVA